MWPFTRHRKQAAPAGNPLPVPLDLSLARRVLVVAPHPDDETIGCGGTLARLAGSCEVQLLLVTNGDGGGELPPDTSARRKEEMTRAARTLGIQTPVLHLDEPDGRFADSRRYRSALGAVLERFDPNWVFLPWLNDTHADHARIARASSEVLRHSGVELLLYYETWTPVPATHVVDITSTVAAKQAALQCHVTALRYGNYMDAMMGLSAYRALYLPTRERRWAEVFCVTDPRRNPFM